MPSVIGTLGGGQNTPWELDGVLMAYIEEHRDTYAIRWIDRGHGGTIVLAFTDDPGPHLEAILARRPSESDPAPIVPRPPLTVDWTVAESGYAVDVVQVDFTEAELRELADEAAQVLFGRDDIEVVGMGSGNMTNRVTLTMIRPNAEDLQIIADEFPDRAEMFCVEGPLWDESLAPPPLDEPLEILAGVEDDPLVTCSSSAPFRLSILDGPADIDPSSADPLIVALMTQSMDGFPVPPDGWRTLIRDDTNALFGRFFDMDGTQGASLHRFENTAGGWSIRSTSSGECRMRHALPEGVDYMRSALDPAHPIDPDSTTLHLLVSQEACSGGRSGVENLYPPEVIETDTEIRIALVVLPPEGSQTCPGNIADPITIELDSPIGHRTVADGLTVPPSPLSDRIDY